MKRFYRFVFNLYSLWSRVYRKIQRMNTTKKQQMWVDRKIDSIYMDTFNIHNKHILPVCDPSDVMRYWKKICEEFNLKWMKDTWKVLWDVVPNPVSAFLRGGDDCDGFAAMGEYAIGDRIRVTNGDSYDVYYFDGIWCYVKGFSGHAVAVWKSKNRDQEKFMMISNDDLFFFIDRKSLDAYNERIVRDFKYVGKFDRQMFLKEIE